MREQRAREDKVALEPQRPAESLRARGRASAVEVEQSLDQLARWMDNLFRIPGVGWRFGLDALVGLIPGIGDSATTLVSFYVLAAGVRYRVPKITLLRMGFNIGLDYLFGAIPVVGDLFDAAWKSNQKNIELIRSAPPSRPPKRAAAGRATGSLSVSLCFCCSRCCSARLPSASTS